MTLEDNVNFDEHFGFFEVFIDVDGETWRLGTEKMFHDYIIHQHQGIEANMPGYGSTRYDLEIDGETYIYFRVD